MKLQLEKNIFATVAFFLFSVATASQASNFGSNGRDGWDGRSGADGESGRSVNLLVTGEPVNIDVSGEDGGDGRDGERGDDAFSCFAPSSPSYDLEGANGGDGGDGGNGGKGGNSGDVTIFYEDEIDLKRVSIVSVAGDGGESGRSARGGQGCDCWQLSWQITDSNGNTKTYYCYDGREGGSGWGSRNGSDGFRGQLNLVPGLTEIPDEVRRIHKRLPDFIDTELELSINLWDDLTGAHDLFSPSSDISNRYTLYRETVRGKFMVNWNSDRPLSKFEDTFGIAKISETGQIEFSTADDLLVESSNSQRGGVHVVSIENAVFEGELDDVGYEGNNGIGTMLAVNIEDTARVGEIVDTKVELKYQTQDFILFKTRWEGIVPADTVTISENQITVNIGSLPIESKYLKKKKWAQIKFKVTRTFAGTSKTKKISKRFQIGIPDSEQ